MLIKIALAVSVLVLVYFVYLYFYTRNMNNFTNNRKKYIDINVFRISLVFIGIIWVSGFSVYSLVQVNAQQEERTSYLEDYVSIYDQMTYTDERIYEIYTNYNLYFGGMYFDGPNTVLLIREDISQGGLDYLNSTGLDYHFVKYNYHELLSARIQIEKVIIQSEGWVEICIDDINNCVSLTIITDSTLPDDLNEFIESGILQISETDYPITLT